MVVSLHPRTADKLARFGLDPQLERVRLLAPLGLFDFVKLEKHAHCVLSDSGTVQEECCIFRVPNVTVRDVLPCVAGGAPCYLSVFAGRISGRCTPTLRRPLNTPEYLHPRICAKPPNQRQSEA